MIGSENNLRLANEKATGLSIQKLTRDNPALQAMFDEAQKAREENVEEEVDVMDMEDDQ